MAKKNFYELSSWGKIKRILDGPRILFLLVFPLVIPFWLFFDTAYYGTKGDSKIYFFKNIFDKKGKLIKELEIPNEDRRD